MGTEESPTGEHHYSASAEDRVDQRIALAMTGSCCEMNWVLVTAGQRTMNDGTIG